MRSRNFAACSLFVFAVTATDGIAGERDERSPFATFDQQTSDHRISSGGMASSPSISASPVYKTFEYARDRFGLPGGEPYVEGGARLGPVPLLDATELEDTGPLPIKTATPSQPAAGGGGGASELDKANQAIANPLADATLFIQEFNTVFLDGDLVPDDNRVTGIYAVDPLIPVPLTDEWSVVLRPIIPVAVAADLPVSGGTAGPGSGGGPGLTFENKTGLGDISFFTLFTKKTASPFKFGAGPAFRFPTATDDRLGSEKFSVGAAAVGLYSSPRFSAGVLNQNYFSVAGPNGRDDVRTSTFQYFGFYNFTPEWGIGTAPTISIDWEADDDKVLFPVGLGIAHTFKIKDVPTRLLLEGQYYAIQRDAFGPEWNLRVALAMFLPPLLSEPLF